MLLQPIDSQFVAKAFFFSLVVARKIEQFSSMLSPSFRIKYQWMSPL